MSTVARLAASVSLVCLTAAPGSAHAGEFTGALAMSRNPGALVCPDGDAIAARVAALMEHPASRVWVSPSRADVRLDVQVACDASSCQATIRASGASQGLLIAMALAISAGMWIWLAKVARPVTAAGIGLILGGALANAFDRAVYGAVADFFSFHVGNFNWYIFNLADVAIVAGVGLLVYESFTEGRSK